MHAHTHAKTNQPTMLVQKFMLFIEQKRECETCHQVILLTPRTNWILHTWRGRYKMLHIQSSLQCYPEDYLTNRCSVIMLTEVEPITWLLNLSVPWLHSWLYSTSSFQTMSDAIFRSFKKRRLSDQHLATLWCLLISKTNCCILL